MNVSRKEPFSLAILISSIFSLLGRLPLRYRSVPCNIIRTSQSLLAYRQAWEHSSLDIMAVMIVCTRLYLSV